MLKPEQVPMAVWKAALEEYYNAPGEEPLRRAIAAALNAWPGMAVFDRGDDPDEEPHIILPLTTEASDEQ